MFSQPRIQLAALGLIACGCAGNRMAVRPSEAHLPASTALSQVFNRARWSDAPIDTIVVRMDSLDLRAGQSLSLAAVLGAEGRTSAGNPIPGFVPVFVLESRGAVVEVTGHGLQALGAGTATLLVVPLASPRGRVVQTRVPIRVH